MWRPSKRRSGVKEATFKWLRRTLSFDCLSDVWARSFKTCYSRSSFDFARNTLRQFSFATTVSLSGAHKSFGLPILTLEVLRLRFEIAREAEVNKC
jgi:hypothetical protein